jgi:hypothetical protein
MMDRREFVQACAVLLGGSVMITGCGGGSDSNLSSAADGSSANGLAKDRWMQLPVTTFSVTHDTYGVIDMELTTIEDEYYTPETEQFSVTLKGPDNPLFDEDKYLVYNDSLGYLELFLQPGESAPGEQTYRAVFSLLQS